MTLLARAFGSRYSARKPAPASSQLRFDALEDRSVPASVPDLGSAAGYTVLGLHGGTVQLSDSQVTGDVAIGPNGTVVLKRTAVTGTLFEDPTASVDVRNPKKTPSPTGGEVTRRLRQAQSDADAASAALDALTPTVSLGNLTKSATVNGNGGLNVVHLRSVDYHNDTLTLRGGSQDVFVIDVDRGLSLDQSRVVLTGGVTADHVIFNLAGSGADVNVSGSRSSLNGTILAPRRSVDVEDLGAFHGAVIARDIALGSGAALAGATFAAPTPPVVPPPPPPVVPPPPPPATTASLSGLVWSDFNKNGVVDANEVLSGVTVELDGTDAQGNLVSVQAVTDANGLYSFTGLAAGTYMLTQLDFQGGTVASGNLGGQVDNVNTPGVISNIVVTAGSNGTGYNFTDQFAGA